ncbi:MAG: inorganic phosphate transporter [Tidjanibacter sp.]|nr:inorganic phosphate transporter [Tidjanibacter sp.]
MSPIFTFILITLIVLAIFDIIVGVANDAVNFLNAAMGSKITTRKVILTVAAVGIMVGVMTSSGMMEVARSGVFYPAQFTFSEIMVLFLGMIIGDIILLDIFNSLGLPTSTTVSMVFGLLGAAVAVSLHHIYFDPSVTMANLSEYINTGKALAIISGILISVAVAFVAGMVLMYLSRLIFSFRYHKIFSRFGAFWCGISLTGIVYFILFKGLKSSGLVPDGLIEFINGNTALALLVIWLGCSLVLFLLQRAKVNILKITILAGTFSLALAFAGNDLVNFIGVSYAGYDSYRLALEAGSEQIMMSGLSEPVKANHWILGAAGMIMILTLFFNKKAMKVTETELSLSSQNEGDEHFASSKLSRGLVRMAMIINNSYNKVVPERVRVAINKRFTPLTADERGDASYDLIRATVNLTAASILISLATSLKLPLSTTYVVFMVAMGSSLADRAWGRETAVYRITGVFTVISGWFLTALCGFLMSLLITSIMAWGGNVAIVIMVIVCLAVIVYSTRSHRRRAEREEMERLKLAKHSKTDDLLVDCTDEVIETMERVNRIYNRTMVGLFKENRKVLREMLTESKELLEEARRRKYGVITTLRQFESHNIEAGHFYVQVVDYISEVTKALYHVVRPAAEHIENHHSGLLQEQVADLMSINNSVEEIFGQINQMIRNKDFASIDEILDKRDRLFEEIAFVTKNQLQRINDTSIETPTRASLLYLDILNETKSMVLQARNLVKSQRYFIENQIQ